MSSNNFRVYCFIVFIFLSYYLQHIWQTLAQYYYLRVKRHSINYVVHFRQSMICAMVFNQYLLQSNSWSHVYWLKNSQKWMNTTNSLCFLEWTDFNLKKRSRNDRKICSDHIWQNQSFGKCKQMSVNTLY